MAQEDDEKLKRRAEFLEQKRMRRKAEAKTTEQIIEGAKALFSTPASKEFLESWTKNGKKIKRNKVGWLRLVNFISHTPTLGKTNLTNLKRSDPGSI